MLIVTALEQNYHMVENVFFSNVTFLSKRLHWLQRRALSHQRAVEDIGTRAVRILFPVFIVTALEQNYQVFDLYSVTSNVMFLWEDCISCNGRAPSHQRAVEDFGKGAVHMLFPFWTVTALEQSYHIFDMYEVTSNVMFLCWMIALAATGELCHIKRAVEDIA